MPNIIGNLALSIACLYCWGRIGVDLIQDHASLFVHLVNTLFWFWFYNLFRSEVKI